LAKLKPADAQNGSRGSIREQAASADPDEAARGRAILPKTARAAPAA